VANVTAAAKSQANIRRMMIMRTGYHDSSIGYPVSCEFAMPASLTQVGRS
jgi:formylmethanofuran dehydrogenase subunit A